MNRVDNINIVLIGALTSKPYAFVSRPWEITSSEGIDFFDSFLSSIRVDERGLKIVRILPAVDNTRNEDWISDRIRFSYNSRENQRLFNNFIFYDFFKYTISNRRFSILTFLSFSKSSFSVCNFGLPTPLELQYFFYNFFSFYNYKISNIFFNKFANFDFRNSFSSIFKIKSFFESVKKNDMFFIVNFNTRFLSPVFNIFFRSKVSNVSDYPIFFFGSSNLVNFPNYINFGSNFFNFINLVSGKNKINKIKTKKFSMFVSPFFPIQFNNNFLNYKFPKFFDFKFFDFNTSSFISSEINFSSSYFSTLNDKYHKDFNSISVSFNSCYDVTSVFAKFNFSFESNFDFSNTTYHTDFLGSFPDIFSCVSSFISLDGDFKITNNFKKYQNISNTIIKYFDIFFDSYEINLFSYPFLSFSSSFLPYNTNFDKKNNYNCFFYMKKIISDSIYSHDSARSHYITSPYSKYSIPLILHYSRFKNTTFNHNFF
jgi:hypothetical protein